jgi:hypothetical protein
MNEPLPTLPVIEARVHALRQSLDAAAQTLAEYEAEVAPIRDRYAPRLRRHGAEIRSIRQRVLDLIAAAPKLFVRPKSRVVHGIKIGVRKAADRWAWPAEDALVELIQAHCTAEQQAAYLVTTTVGRKDAIPPEARESLGIGCTPGADTPLCEEQTSGTAAALLALLGELPEELPEEAQP